MNRRIVSRLVLFAASVLCGQTVVFAQTPPSPPGVQNYQLKIEYYNQNEFGRTNDVAAYDAAIRVERQGDQDSILWSKYDLATAVNKANAEWGDFTPEVSAALKFKPYAPGTGLAYLWGKDDMSLKTFESIEGIRKAPRDLEGFRLYLHAIDLFTFLKVYPSFLADPVAAGIGQTPFAKVGDRIFTDQRTNTLKLMDWENVGKDLVMQTGFIEITYLADTTLGGRPVKLFGFQQSQRFGETLTTQGLTMPMDETTRFLGHLWMDADGTLVQVEFQEYVYVLVHAPMLINVTAHTKRHFVLSRVF